MAKLGTERAGRQGGNPDDTSSAACPEQIQAFCDFHEEYVSRNIQLADAKAGLVLVAYTSLLIFLMKEASFQNAIRSSVLQFDLLSTNWGHTVLWLGTGLCIVGLTFAFLVVAPRLGGANADVATGSGRGSVWSIGKLPQFEPGKITYFAQVAAFPSASAYAERVAGLALDDINADRLAHLFELSQVCWQKMVMLKKAMWLGGVGVTLLATWVVFVAPIGEAAGA